MASDITTTLRFRHVLTPDGMLHEQQLELDGSGRIRRIVAADGQGDREGGRDGAWDGYLALPGMPNAHSHVFQRALAGHGETRAVGNTEDSFWSWREAMYRMAGRMSPDDLHVIARQGFMDMLRAGFTSVAEFHYLHHLPDGTRTRALADAVIAAAEETGIRLRLLPVAYFTSGFGGQAPQPGQRRFVHDSVDEYLALVESLATCRPGIAPHSLRAVPIEWLGPLLAGAKAILGDDFPVHLHIAEQVAELEQCRAAHGVTPIQLLLDRQTLNARWNLVHATHATKEELANVAESGANIVLCPITEAYLGDGLFPAVAFASMGGRTSIGSDSNCRIDVFEELRVLEYGQRLRDQRRARLADSNGLTALFAQTAKSGADGLGMSVGVIAEGAEADLMVIGESAAALSGHEIDTAIDALIINGSRSDISDVYVGGRRVVHNGRADGDDAVAREFNATVRRLLQEN